MSIRDLLVLNLTLQAFDGLFSLQAFALGAVEANPIVAARLADGSRVTAAIAPARQTGADSLEAAFLKLTGTTIRDETFSAEDRMRQVSRVWRR